MLNSTEYLLKSSEPLNYQMSSLFQGALMERIPETFGDFLHQSQMHPYSQHLEKRGSEWFWIINTLDDPTHEEFQKIIRDEDHLTLRKHDIEVDIARQKSKMLDEKKLRDIFYVGEVQSYFHIRFLTPTAFKRQGNYLFYPELFCIYQSLMNRCDAVFDWGFSDQDTLEELTANSKIISYRLNSTLFSLEGVRIPSFLGKISIKVGGTDTMKRFAKMLFQFGEYSGIGIKTSMGMGAISLEEVEHKWRKESLKKE